MAITMRIGPYAKLDPSKALAGEWLIVVSGDPNSKDGRSIYHCFQSGTVKRMATYEDLVDMFEQMNEEEIAQLTAGVNAAINSANTAATNANNKAGLADSAATNASNKATVANTAATRANAAAQAAEDVVIGKVAASIVSFNNAGTIIKGTNVQQQLELTDTAVQKLNTDLTAEIKKIDDLQKYIIASNRAVRYGIRINKNDPNPETRCEYLFDAVGKAPARMNYVSGAFDYGDWTDVFFVKQNYPAMVKYDGTEDYKLSATDQTKKEDGTASDVSNTAYSGNAMSVFDGSAEGKIWLSQFEIGDYEYMVISNQQCDASYRDDAYVQEDGSHSDKLYYPMFGGSYDGTRLRSIADQTLMYNTNASTEIARAKANGTGWNIGTWSKRNLLNCMLKIMSKTDNSQVAFGRGQVSGYVDDASLNYGHLSTGTLKSKGQFCGYNDNTHEVKVFFIEKCWGNRWDRINGLILKGGEVLAKMEPPYNLQGNDYEKAGIKFTGNGSGWQKETKSSNLGRIVKTCGGSSSTYTCDHFWYNADGTKVALVGGDCSNGEYCGADCLRLYNSEGAAVWGFGASVYLN